MSHPARVYVDESFGDNGSFVVQTAVTLPAGNAEIAFNEIREAELYSGIQLGRERSGLLPGDDERAATGPLKPSCEAAVGATCWQVR